MVQYIIEIYNVTITITIKETGLMQWIGVYYFLFILW